LVIRSKPRQNTCRTNSPDFPRLGLGPSCFVLRAVAECGKSDGRKTPLANMENLERAMGFEPTTPTLARLCFAAEFAPVPRRARLRLPSVGSTTARLISDRLLPAGSRERTSIGSSGLPARPSTLCPRDPAKSPSMSAVSRPCSRSLIPQKLPKKLNKRTILSINY
jgi:hypothetical protein